MTDRGNDVFLSYSNSDAAAAAVVHNALREGGVSVFDIANTEPGGDLWSRVRDAITVSEAMVLVLDRSSVAPNVAVEVGAALAWSKPVFVVESVEQPQPLPSYLQSFRRFKLDALRPLVEAIQSSKEELSEKELEWLGDWYGRNGIPLDHVISDPAALDRLATQFEQQFHRWIAADRLLQALLRLRKRGHLPTVGRSKRG